MSLTITPLEEKDYREILPYTFDLTPINTFGDATETIASVVWAVYNDTDAADSYTDLSSTMLVSAGDSFDNTLHTVTRLVQSGTKDTTYILSALITCSSGCKYLVLGRFKVVAKG